VNISQTTEKSIFDLFPYSLFSKVVRVLAWCRRWICKATSKHVFGPLTTGVRYTGVGYTGVGYTGVGYTGLYSYWVGRGVMYFKGDFVSYCTTPALWANLEEEEEKKRSRVGKCAIILNQENTAARICYRY